MKKALIFIVIIFSLFINIPTSYGLTKDDIFKLVDSQKVCDGSTSFLFKSYSTTYTRLINEKQLSETDISNIINYLTSAIDILNKKNVCKLSDISKLTNEEKTIVLNSLLNGSKIITNAKSIVENNNVEDNKNDGVVIDTTDKTIKVYDNGNLIDKVEINNIKLTYTGPTIWISIGLVILFILFILYFALKIKKIRTIYLDIIKSFIYSLFIILFVNILFRNQIDSLYNYKNILSKVNTNTSDRTVVLDNNNKIIRYPGYGNIYATLTIPNLGINNQVSFGDSQELLKTNIGHYTASKLPGEGDNIIFSGHNSSAILGNLKEIKNDDIIIVKTSYGEFKYKVYEIKIVKDTDINSINVESDKETLTLYTCYPFSNIIYGNQRYIVYSELFESNYNGDTND